MDMGADMDWNAVLASLHSLTQAIAKSAADGDLDLLQQNITERQTILESAAGEKAKAMSPSQRAALGDIIALDREASAAVRKAYESARSETLSSQRKYDGIVKYDAIKYDSLRGRLLDKRR